MAFGWSDIFMNIMIMISELIKNSSCPNLPSPYLPQPVAAGGYGSASSWVVFCALVVILRSNNS